MLSPFQTSTHRVATRRSSFFSTNYYSIRYLNTEQNKRNIKGWNMLQRLKEDGPSSTALPTWLNTPHNAVHFFFDLLCLAGSTYYLRGKATSLNLRPAKDDIRQYPGREELHRQGEDYTWHPVHWASDGAALAWISQEKKHLIVAIRGTKISSYKNLITDLRYFKKRQAELEGTRVHSGFEEAARFLLRELYDMKLLPPRRHNQTEKKQWSITLTGHSLGGAVACVLGMYLHAHGFHVREVVTFGQPMVTNYQGAHEWNDKIRLVRIINDRDPIPLTPPTLPLPLNLWGGRYFHFGTQIRVTEKGKFKVASFQDTLQSQHTSFWKEILHRHITFGDHRSAPGDFYPTNVLHYEYLQQSPTQFRGDYFEEILFALYRTDHGIRVAQTNIIPKNNRNDSWVRYKKEKIVEAFRLLLQHEIHVNPSLPLESSLKTLKNMEESNKSSILNSCGNKTSDTNCTEMNQIGI